MAWILIIVILVLLLACWLLLSPFLLELDTASLSASFTWKGIGNANVWYNNEWWLFFRIFFFHKKIKLQGLNKKKEKPALTPLEKKPGTPVPYHKIVSCLKTFRVDEWTLAIDTGDYPLNAKLYPLNFLPGLRDHLDVNFMDRNYFYLKIRNTPWKLLYAYLQ